MMSVELKHFYANGLEAGMSAYDISFKFLRNGASSKDDSNQVSYGSGAEVKAVQLDTMTVSMSPSHAKSMLPALWKLVEQYEQLFGKIPMPPEAEDAWHKTFKE